MKYIMVLDAAQGERKGADSFAAAVAHEERRDGQRVAVQDALYEAAPPFSPKAVLAEIAALATRYRITRVHGDQTARGFVAELLREHGLTFVELERDRSALYLDALAMLNSGQAVLLDHPKQRRQILALRRAIHTGGRTSVDHPRGGHDDVANVGLAALVVAFGVSGKHLRRSVIYRFGPSVDGSRGERIGGSERPALTTREERQREQNAAMIEMCAAVKEREEARALRDFELNKALANEPMVPGSAVWHDHNKEEQ